MSVLVSLITHNKNAEHLDKVLNSIENLEGSFDLEVHSFDTEDKIIDYFKNKDIKLITYKRPVFENKDDNIKHFTGMDRREMSQLVFLRNKVLERLLDTDYSYQLLVDSDVIFKKETIERLLTSKKDVVGGWYFNKRFPDAALNAIPLPKYTEEFLKEEKLFRVKTIGAGCLLLSRKIIEEGNRFPYKTLRGEDWDFSANLVSKKYEVWCDGYLYCEHLGEFLPEAERYKNNKIKEWNL